MRIILLLLAFLGSGHAAQNVRFKEIGSFANTPVLKNYGDGAETGSPEGWWNTGDVLPRAPDIEVSIRFTTGGQAHFEVTSRIDPGASDAKRRFYQEVELTL